MNDLRDTYLGMMVRKYLFKYYQHKVERDKCFPEGVKFVDLLNGRYISRKPIYDFIVKCSEKFEGKCLDFGCGSKQYEHLFKHTDEYVGIDVQDAKDNGFQANNIIYYDGAIIPFEDNVFDCAIAIEVFEHIFTDLDSLLEINRVLRVGGLFLITVPMTFPLHLEPWDFHRYTEHGIKKLVMDAGFELIEIKHSTSFKNTIRRLKILEISNKFNAMYGLKKKIYQLIRTSSVLINNILFCLCQEDNEHSKCSMNIMLLCRKR